MQGMPLPGSGIIRFDAIGTHAAPRHSAWNERVMRRISALGTKTRMANAANMPSSPEFPASRQAKCMATNATI